MKDLLENKLMRVTIGALVVIILIIIIIALIVGMLFLFVVFKMLVEFVSLFYYEVLESCQMLFCIDPGA